MVEGDRPLHDAEQRLAPFAVELVLAAGVVADRDPGPCRQSLHGFDEVAALDAAEERDRVAGGLAAEAVVEALLGVDRERRRLLGMKRAQALTKRRPTRLSGVYSPMRARMSVADRTCDTSSSGIAIAWTVPRESEPGCGRDGEPF